MTRDESRTPVRPRHLVPDLAELEPRLWAAADALRANSSLTPAEYRGPVLGLIFLAFAEHRFDELRPELELKATERRPVSADDFRARGVLFVPEIARLSWLVDLPEGEDLGANIDLAIDRKSTRLKSSHSQISHAG